MISRLFLLLLYFKKKTMQSKKHCHQNNNNKMKQSNYILLSILAIGLMVSCAEKKKSKIIIAPKPVEQVTNKPTQEMSGYEQARDVEWLGNHYKVVVKREADHELPIIQLDKTTKYYDNKITIRILRSDGTEFFNRTFTKTAFESYLDKQTKSMGALLGIVFDKAEGNNLCFAASVGSPDITSDEYLPLVLKISRMGAVSISKDQVLDTESASESASSSASSTSKEDLEDDDEGV